MKSIKHLICLSLMFLAVVCISLTACSDKDETIWVDWDSPVVVTSQQETSDVLKAAQKEGKTISHMEKVEENGQQGWKITFADSSTILILGSGEETLISSITQDQKAKTLTLTVTGGSSYTLNLDDSYGIGTSFLSFRIREAEASWMGENTISVKLPYGTAVSAMQTAFAINGARVYVGDTEQESGKTVNDFSSPVTYRIVSSQGKEQTYVVTICYSNLPIIYINTKNKAEITSKTEWVTESQMVIGNTGGLYDMEYENMNIRGRGNSTWNYPKKPYAIKLDKKAEVLGMPKHKRWCLLANWMDRTLMRNAVAFEIARCTENLEWTPRGQFVEVVLNGEFIGNYYLCEQIKADENRVAITEMESTDIEGNAVTGGYILELDTNYDEVNKFRSQYGEDSGGNVGMPVNIKEPDDDVLVSEQFDYIKDYFCTAESLLYADDFPTNKAYKDYIDLPTFVDWWLVHELAQNGEPSHPKSCYMYKDRNGKLKAGPVWDFDWGTFRPGQASTFRIKDAIWYGKLFLDPDFVALVKEQWANSKTKFETVADFIDSQAELIKVSANANIELWPITSTTNGDESMSFDEAVARMKSVYLQHIDWMDSAIKNL